MAWDKHLITRENGEEVMAQAPVIVSASRSTDIPGFYADWFFHRLKVGYSAWTNPFNGVKGYVSYDNTRFIVFWSKNPRPLLKHLDYLNERNIKCYIQYTLNDYENEGLEKGVPPLQSRIETFKALVDKLGVGSVVWRFDPLILTDTISIETLLNKIENIGDQLKGYTEKLVFSFADIASYRKVKANLDANKINYREWTESDMILFAQKLADLNQKNGWNYELATCGEKAIFQKFGIQPNHCVDDTLMIRIAYNDPTLMKYLGVDIRQCENLIFDEEIIPSGAIKLPGSLYAVKNKDNKDKGQRTLCGCMVSKDIGEYNTCIHLCEYCYANTSKEIAKHNYEIARMAGLKSETITGK